MKEPPKENFIDEEIDQLIEQFHKNPTREVRDRLNCVLIMQRDKHIEKEQKKEREGRDLGRNDTIRGRKQGI